MNAHSKASYPPPAASVPQDSLLEILGFWSSIIFLFLFWPFLTAWAIHQGGPKILDQQPTAGQLMAVAFVLYYLMGLAVSAMAWWTLALFVALYLLTTLCRGFVRATVELD